MDKKELEQRIKRGLKMKSFFKQLFAYLKPIKGHGTIGMLQRTIVYSEWVLIFSVIISFILECVNSYHDGWLQYFENFAIGIACSDVIVIVTTFTQFFSERNNTFDVFYNSSFNWICYLYEASYATQLGNQKRVRKFLVLIKKESEICTKPLLNLFWFNQKYEYPYEIAATKLKALIIRQNIFFENDDFNVTPEMIEYCREDIASFFKLIGDKRYQMFDLLKESYKDKTEVKNDQL